MGAGNFVRCRLFVLLSSGFSIADALLVFAHEASEVSWIGGSSGSGFSENAKAGTEPILQLGDTDMKHITLRISIAALALACAGCNLTGPSESLTGDWTASTGVTSFVGMTLHQDGDDISGTACSRSDGVLLYHGVPVRGDHPDVAFEVTSRYTQPCCAHLAGVRFSGELDGTHGIVGRLNDVEIRFERSGSRACP